MIDLLAGTKSSSLFSTKTRLKYPILLPFYSVSVILCLLNLLAMTAKHQLI